MASIDPNLLAAKPSNLVGLDPSQVMAQPEEEEYEGFLQEVGEGIVSGLIAIP